MFLMVVVHNSDFVQNNKQCMASNFVQGDLAPENMLLNIFNAMCHVPCAMTALVVMFMLRMARKRTKTSNKFLIM